MAKPGKRTGKGKASGAAAKGILKSLDNVLKDGKELPDAPGPPRTPGGRSTPTSRSDRPVDPQSQRAQERFDNFRRQVEPGELRGAPPPVPGGRPGHARSSHGVLPNEQASILNSPERIFSGTYHGNYRGTAYTREVDIYYSDRSVVITEAGKKDSVITAYGMIDQRAETPRPVNPDQWAGDPNYVEVRPHPANEVIYPNRERWEEQDWP